MSCKDILLNGGTLMNINELNIIPNPKHTELLNENKTHISCSIFTNHNEFKNCVNAFRECSKLMFGANCDDTAGGIELIFDETIEKNAYKLKCKKIPEVFASDIEGMFYGVSTLLQLAEYKEGKFVFPCLEIVDKPDKEFRSFMIDVAREWHAPDKIHKYIDLCFIYKIKYLHIHFIDDQRYTLPSKAFPSMVTTHQSYTYDDIASFNSHAKSRGITIIPEFETTGHAKIYVKKYKQIFANVITEPDDNLMDGSNEFYSPDTVVCAGNPEVTKAFSTIADEICELFPESPYIHIGGDEAYIKAWNCCDVCCNYMKENNIDDIYDLYSHYVSKMTHIILEKGRIPIVWEGFPVKGCKKIPRETIVTVWDTSYHRPDELLKEGFKIINASSRPLYITSSVKKRYSMLDILEWNVYNWKSGSEKNFAYLNPINVSSCDDVVGGELCTWENTYELEVNFVMENLAAMSEKVWNVKRIDSDEIFMSKYEKLVQKISRLISDK